MFWTGSLRSLSSTSSKKTRNCFVCLCYGVYRSTASIQIFMEIFASGLWPYLRHCRFSSFTTSLVTRLLQNYSHFSKELAQRLEPWHLQLLEKGCDTCQPFQYDTRRLRVSFVMETIRFNERVVMDVMYLRSWPVIHIVDEFAHISSACFLTYSYSKKICENATGVRGIYLHGASRQYLSRLRFLVQENLRIYWPLRWRRDWQVYSGRS